MLRSRRSKSKGQTVSEYLLVISVIVIALRGVMFPPLYAAFEEGTADIREDYKCTTQNGAVGSCGAYEER